MQAGDGEDVHAEGGGNTCMQGTGGNTCMQGTGEDVHASRGRGTRAGRGRGTRAGRETAPDKTLLVIRPEHYHSQKDTTTVQKI